MSHRWMSPRSRPFWSCIEVLRLIFCLLTRCMSHWSWIFSWSQDNSASLSLITWPSLPSFYRCLYCFCFRFGASRLPCWSVMDIALPLRLWIRIGLSKSSFSSGFDVCPVIGGQRFPYYGSGVQPVHELNMLDICLFWFQVEHPSISLRCCIDPFF